VAEIIQLFALDRSGNPRQKIDIAGTQAIPALRERSADPDDIPILFCGDAFDQVDNKSCWLSLVISEKRRLKISEPGK
jgi:hypothetical protein